MNQLLDGRYQIIKILGADELEQTYLVGDTQLPDYPKCVIRHLKLPANQTPRTLQFVLTLLKKKAESLQKFSEHDQIPKILAYFEEGDNFYLVEEFVLGQSVADELTPGRPMPEIRVVQLLQEILDILVIVHGRGLVHRRIKPSSLIRRQSNGLLVLTGFGIFRAIGAQIMRSTSPPDSNGSLAYTPPDQIEGQHQFSSDLYAVGMIAIRALTGLSAEDLLKLSFIGPSGVPALSWHDHAQASSELVNILDRMIHPQREQRYQQASEVLDDLRKMGANRDSPLPAISGKVFNPLSGIKQSRHRWLSSMTRQRRSLPAIAALLVVLVIMILATKVPQSLLARYFWQRGLSQQQQDQQEQALASYSQAIQLSPTDETYLKRGKVYEQLAQPQNALDDFSRSIQLNPKQAEAYYHRGNIWLSLGDRQKAIADYTQAIQLDPNVPEAYVNRGTVRADSGDEQGAIADYTQALQINPNLTAAYLNRCLSRSNVNDHQGAIADCTQAINLQPNSVLAYQNRGLVRRRIGDKTGAIEDFNIAIRLDPKDADPYYNRGLARYELGDKQGAIADYTEAIQRDGNHVFAYYDRGLVRLELGDREGAIADFQQSAKLCLDSARMGCYQDAQFQLKKLQQSP